MNMNITFLQDLRDEFKAALTEVRNRLITGSFKDYDSNTLEQHQIIEGHFHTVFFIYLVESALDRYAATAPKDIHTLSDFDMDWFIQLKVWNKLLFDSYEADRGAPVTPAMEAETPRLLEYRTKNPELLKKFDKILSLHRDYQAADSCYEREANGRLIEELICPTVAEPPVEHEPDPNCGCGCDENPETPSDLHW